MTARSRRWLLVGAVLIAASAVAMVVDRQSTVAGTLGLLAVLWLAVSVWFVMWRAWRWLTYRVSVRLLISYLLVGVTPFVVAAAFAAVGLWIVMGQYTSVRFGSEMRRVRLQLAWECGAVLERAGSAGPEAALALLRELTARHPENVRSVGWQARIGGREVRLGGLEDLPLITWVDGEASEVVARHGERNFAVVAAADDSGDRIAALIPLDSELAASISRGWWFDVALLSTEGDEVTAAAGEAPDNQASASAEVGGDITFSIDGQTYTGEELWPPWSGDSKQLLARPSVIWARVTPEVLDMATGVPIEGARVLALLRTSPTLVWDDFTMSRYQIGSNIVTPLAFLGTFFVIVYALVAAVAAMMIISITRSVKRLTVGAREVERGNLDHRVPVKRRDQLGDLARSFNHMTDSVQSMVLDVAEKERLARELELAREIQESLLPARRMVHGPLSVHATFRPAAEVGGDYFDIFPISDTRLVVAVGDVAGHGLSTGLLMASLKSSVAALVGEGYSGSRLIERTNRLLLHNSQQRTLVTLLVVEIDLTSDHLLLANAGHTPPVQLAGGLAPDELMAGSVPLGSPLCKAATVERAFPAGSRLLLYSDGLVEAVSPSGEPFGYDRLHALLGRHAELGAEGLIAVILDALEDHMAVGDPIDDLTLLVIERAP